MIFIDWYLPGQNAGGPVRTCANMVERISDEFEFYIVTRNTDLKSSHPYENITSDEWNLRNDGSKVYYFSSGQLSFWNIKKLILQVNPDAIHLNSLFSYYFTILPLLVIHRMKLTRNVVVGPRGMLSKGALAIKPFKKKFFIRIAKFTRLFSNVTWHASTPIEEGEIRMVFGNTVKVKLGIDLAPATAISRIKRIKKQNEGNFFFLGRVSKVKNLLQCLTIMRNLEPQYKMNYDIFGPVEEKEYWDQCVSEIKLMKPDIVVKYMGQIDNGQLSHLLKKYHFLFLLTENENYGHAIVESMVAGCPVIISDRTPWRNLESVHAGWDLTLDDSAAILKTLHGALQMNQTEYNRWSEGAYDLAVKITESKDAVEDNKNLFR